MKKKGLIILGVILVIIALFSFINMNANKEQYKTRALKKRTIVQSVFASGTVNPVITVSIGSQVSGTIKELYVDYNSEVKKGQLLIEFDREAIAAEGYDTITPVVICNSADYSEVKTFTGKTVNAGEKIIALVK